MCRHCVKFGDGKKWYLNPKNYTNEVIDSELTKVQMETNMVGQLLGLKGTMREIATTAKRFQYDVGFGEHIDDAFPDLNDEMAHTLREGFPDLIDLAIGGQVVPLEDAEKIIDLSPGDIFVIPCLCRKYYGGKEKMCCMFPSPGGEELQKNVSWDTPNKMVSKEEAKEMLREFDKEGLFHGIFWCPAPIPSMICNCEYPYCIALRARLHYDIVDTYRKGEYVSLVDPNKCNGCDGAPLCQVKCTFGALKYSPTSGKVGTNQFQCWGCGICRTACPNNAITLIPREEIPQLREVW